MKDAANKQILLVVDDDDASRVLIKAILERKNITILESRNGNDALSTFRKYSKEIFLVLLDIQLPDCNGDKMVSLFRQEDASVPIVALSALTPQELTPKAKLAGFDGWMSKPFNIDEFVGMVTSYM